MRSLQGRLGAQLVLALLAVFMILWLVVSNAIRSVAEDYVASRLEHDSETLLAGLSFDAAGAAVIDQARIDAIYQRPFSGHYFQITHDGTVLTSRSLWDQQLVLSDSAIGSATRWHLPGPQQQPLLAVAGHYRKQGKNLTIILAEDFTRIETDIAALQQRFTLIAALLLVVLVVLSIVTVRSGLQPLQRVRQEVDELEQGSRQQLSVAVPREIAPLVIEVNRLLQLLNTRLQRSRHALGDLAHALKKPLTILQQLERDEAIRAHTEMQQTLTTQVDSMRQIIDRQLRRARLAGEGHGGVYFHAAVEIPPLLDALRRIHCDKNLRIVTDYAPELRVGLDREDMLELLGNLLDNAAKWARGQVHLTLRVDREFELVVEDDGSGVAAPDLAALPRRGTRLDESVAGHGLGLAIVSDIVAQYQGRIEYGQSVLLGGLRVAVTLPRGAG